jgi:hypothetical protein
VTRRSTAKKSAAKKRAEEKKRAAQLRSERARRAALARWKKKKTGSAKKKQSARELASLKKIKQLQKQLRKAKSEFKKEKKVSKKAKSKARKAVKKLRDTTTLHRKFKTRVVKKLDSRFTNIMTLNKFPRRLIHETQEQYARRLVRLVMKQNWYDMNEAYGPIAGKSGVSPREVYTLFMSPEVA